MELLHADLTDGLDSTEVQSRRERFGLNRIAESKPAPAWLKLVAQFRELVIWILIVAALIAGVMGEWADTVTILAIVLVNGILGFLQETKAEQALSALRAMSSPMAKVKRNGAIKTIAAVNLVPGDVILLEAGPTAVLFFLFPLTATGDARKDIVIFIIVCAAINHLREQLTDACFNGKLGSGRPRRKSAHICQTLIVFIYVFLSRRSFRFFQFTLVPAICLWQRNHKIG